MDRLDCLFGKNMTIRPRYTIASLSWLSRVLPVVLAVFIMTACKQEQPKPNRDGDMMETNQYPEYDWSKFKYSISEPPPKGAVRYFSGATDIISQHETAMYFLVDVDPYRPAQVDIYLVDKPDAMERVARWVMQHYGWRTKYDFGTRRPSLSPWSVELLQFDKDGRAVSCPYVLEDVGRVKYKELLDLFRRNGKRVDTVPGRKPPMSLGDNVWTPIQWERPPQAKEKGAKER